MANINWEVLGHFTPEGEMHVSGFSLNGQLLFDEPLVLSSMIASLCESVEVIPEHQFSEDGVKQVRALATLRQRAWADVISRLSTSEEQAMLPESDASKANATSDNVTFLVGPKQTHNPQESR